MKKEKLDVEKKTRARSPLRIKNQDSDCMLDDQIDSGQLSPSILDRSIPSVSNAETNAETKRKNVFESDYDSSDSL